MSEQPTLNFILQAKKAIAQGQSREQFVKDVISDVGEACEKAARASYKVAKASIEATLPTDHSEEFLDSYIKPLNGMCLVLVAVPRGRDSWCAYMGIVEQRYCTGAHRLPTLQQVAAMGSKLTEAQALAFLPTQEGRTYSRSM
jgi:hypothetical protein